MDTERAWVWEHENHKTRFPVTNVLYVMRALCVLETASHTGRQYKSGCINTFVSGPHIRLGLLNDWHTFLPLSFGCEMLSKAYF